MSKRNQFNELFTRSRSNADGQPPRCT